MSEVQKPVEAPVAAPVVADVPAVEAPAVSEPVLETPAVEAAAPVAATEPATEPATETPAVAAEEAKKEEVTPVEEGVLGYKGPGLLKSFIFQKKFFWFGTEPVEHKSLTSYLRGEKPEVGNHNAAWASHTGKGLLFFSKKATDKASPAGVINLSEAKDLTEDGTVDFHFTITGHKHTFQASTLAERDNWVSVFKTKIAEAAELAPIVKESETYKSTYSTLSPPIVAAASSPKKSAEIKKEEKAEIKEEKKEEKAEKKEEKKEEKAEKKEEKVEKKKERSVSRKRQSIFGSIFPGKKEETPAAETVPAVEPTTEAAPVEAATAPAVEEAAAAPVEPVTETPAVSEPVTEAKAEEKPAKAKRASIFGGLSFNKKENKEPKAPTVPAKDEPAAVEPVSETAPVIPAPETETPVVAPATEATATPETNGVEAETPVVPANKRKSSLPFGFGSKKEKVVSSDDEAEKPKSPFAKLRATVKGKKAEKTSEKTPEVPETKAEEAVEETPAATTEAPVVSEPVPAVQTTTPQVSATA